MVARHNPFNQVDPDLVGSIPKPEINSPSWKATVVWVEKEIESRRSKLEKIEDLPELHRTQGAIAVLKKLLKQLGE